MYKPSGKFLPRDLKVGANCTLPHNGDPPAKTIQRREGCEIPFPVAGQLSVPEYWAGLREPEIRAAFMSVPEAPVHEHDRPPLWEDKIGLAWQTGSMQAISEPGVPQIFPDLQLRLCVLPANA